MDWPPVWLLIATFKRTEIAIKSIASIKKHLIYPNLHWHICDDGSRETDDDTNRWHVGVLAEAIGGDVTWNEMDTPHGKFNLGGATNGGLRVAMEAGCNIYLIICDDDALGEPWDIRPWVDLLDSYDNMGAFRCAHLSEGLGVMIDSYVAPRLDKRFVVGRTVRDWSIKNPWKPQCYINIYDTIIYHRRFFNAYGMFPEHLHPGLTETGFCAQYSHSPLGENGPAVFIPLGNAPGSPWVHIGKGYGSHYYKMLKDGTLKL
jgi:glycosyltransferase involved in cell wall biosynthesis